MEVLDRMFRHTIDTKSDASACPYPWILSPFISLEAAQSLMQAYPQGVLEKAAGPGASFLTSESIVFSPLEYVMFSPAMIQKSEFDETLWQKFKMMLVAVESLTGNGGGNGVGCQISPVHTVVEQALAFPGKTSQWFARRSCRSNACLSIKRLTNVPLSV